MSEFESPEQRRAQLTAEIARQRGELAVAYKNIGKPIRYCEYGMRGFGLLRQNPWLLSVLPAAFTIGTAAFKMTRAPKPAPVPEKRSFLPKWTGRAEKKAENAGKKEAKTLLDHAMAWGGRGWRLYRLYKKVRQHL